MSKEEYLTVSYTHLAAFCGLSFLLAIKITSKLCNFILHQLGGLHKLWDTPNAANALADFCICFVKKCHTLQMDFSYFEYGRKQSFHTFFIANPK